MTETNEPPPERCRDRSADPPVVIDTRELFRGKTEVWIDHDGMRYRLRVTRRNKLILQK